jgi:hypothetical protein
VVSSGASSTSDSFEWSVQMDLLSGEGNETWSSVEPFNKSKIALKPFSPLDGLAQILMMSSEFLYVD